MRGRIGKRGLRSAGCGLLLILTGVPCGYAISSVPTSEHAGCVDGSRRVGTLKDSVLGRGWAVVVSCAHPGWPAHLEPEHAWDALPVWVPAGSSVRVHAGDGQVAMNLMAVTVVPGRVGQKVTVKLRDGARVAARLVSAEEAMLMPNRRWGQP